MQTYFFLHQEKKIGKYVGNVETIVKCKWSDLMPATHSFSLTPKASKLIRFNKYPRYLGGASKMVSDAIEWYWTENVVTTGAVVDSDNYERDPITLECVACGAKHYKRELRVVGDLMMNIEALQEHLAVAHAEIEELKNRKMMEIIWQKISG